MKVMKCEDCGARLEYDKVTGKAKCPYCGAEHSDDNKTEHGIDKDVQAINDFVGKVEKDINEASSKSSVNILVLVLLFVFCWPLAIVYLIIKMGKDKK